MKGKVNLSVWYGCLIIICVISACSISKNVLFKNDLELPPNCFQVDSNLFCDETEIKNLDWLEYMYWNRHIFGVNSIEFKETLLDTAKWGIDSCLLEYSDYYLRHPATRNYPVVGMTQNQAIRFSKWRRDRVFEQMLIGEGYFEYDENQTPKNYFTTEKYFAGNYNGIIPDSNVLYPDFRLPTLIERNYIMSLIDSVRTHKNTLRKTDDEFVEKYGTIVGGVSMDFICDNNRNPLYPVYKTFNPKSTEIIHHLRGNICEWGDSLNICYGGSWKIPVDSILENDIYLISDTSNVFTGFRNVCEWKNWKYDMR